MKSLLVLLVGTNPLPVWIAWRCLKERFSPPVTAVLLVYTADTRGEFDRLRSAAGDGAGVEGCVTSPGNPAIIRQDLLAALTADRLSPEIGHVHLHFTGGTKVMGVASLAALTEFCGQTGRQLTASYLDPRHRDGPTLIDLDGLELETDVRKGFEPDLRLIARLNGVDIAPRLWTPGVKLREASVALLRSMTRSDLRRSFLQSIVQRDDQRWT